MAGHVVLRYVHGLPVYQLVGTCETVAHLTLEVTQGFRGSLRHVGVGRALIPACAAVLEERPVDRSGRFRVGPLDDICEDVRKPLGELAGTFGGSME